MTCGDVRLADVDLRKATEEPDPTANTYRATVAVYVVRVIGHIEVEAGSREAAKTEILRRFRDRDDTMADARWEPLEIEEGDLRLLSLQELVK